MIDELIKAYMDVDKSISILKSKLKTYINDATNFGEKALYLTENIPFDTIGTIIDIIPVDYGEAITINTSNMGIITLNEINNPSVLKTLANLLVAKKYYVK